MDKHLSVRLISQPLLEQDKYPMFTETCPKVLLDALFSCVCGEYTMAGREACHRDFALCNLLH
jgi:hypothetical protein